MAYGKKNVVKIDPLSYNIGLIGESGIGKEQPVSEPVLTEFGWRTMGGIHVGDKVYSEDGKLYPVTGVFPQGVKDVYEVSFSDGTSTRCGLDHLWTVYLNNGSHDDSKFQRSVMTLREILRDYKCYRNYRYRYGVPVNKPIEYTSYPDYSNELILDPYLLGVYIASRESDCSLRFIMDDKKFEKIKEEFSRHGYSLSVMKKDEFKSLLEDDCNEYIYRCAITECDRKFVYDINNTIPVEYMKAPINIRAKLLKGVIDVFNDYCDHYTSISIGFSDFKLAADIAELCRSLGLIVSHTYENLYCEMNIYGDFKNILGDQYRSTSDNLMYKYKWITNIEKIGTEESQCIMVDCPTHTYITKDFIVTHNTTIIKQMCEKLAGEDSYLFLECGKEDGADAISGINYINCPTWSMEYDEYTNSIGFEELTDDIMEHKSTEYPNLRTVIIDTYDQLIEIAEPEVVAMHNREFKDKPVKSINAAYGGFGKGLDKVNEIVMDRLWDLKKVGVHFIIIGHVKQRTQEDAVTGETYNTLTTNMSLKAFNAMKTKLHFLGVAYIDRSISKEKTGKKDFKNNDVIKGVITGERRRITFRDDNYSVDSKSRFADIVNEVDFDVDAFIKALTDAIAAEAKKGSKSITDLKAEQDAAEERRIQKIAEQEEHRKQQKILDEKLNTIKEFIKANKTKVATKIKPLLELSKKHGFDNPVEVTSIEVADELLALIKTL